MLHTVKCCSSGLSDSEDDRLEIVLQGDSDSDTESSSSQSSSSSVSAPKVTRAPKSTPGPVKNKRQRLEFCRVCQKSIVEEGKRNQGPRLHILKHHLCRPLFKCPHCKSSSNYDKAHVRNHIKRMHKGKEGKVIVVEKHTFIEEERRWFQSCFGSQSRKTFKTSGMPSVKAEKPSVKAKLQMDTKASDDDMNTTVDPSSLNPLDFILFFIDMTLKEKNENSYITV